MEQGKGKIKLAILSFSILMMGVIGISGGLSVIGQHFSNVSQTSIQLLISLPCIAVIPVTLLMGKIQEFVSKKTLIVIGILCFLVGGVAPAFTSSFLVILVLRAIFGIGIGMLQPLSTSLVADNFDGDERSKVMGQQVSAQMMGCAVMVLIGGYLADIGWNMTFYVHFIAIISLILVVKFLPNKNPTNKTVKVDEKALESAPSGKIKLTLASFGWVGTIFLFYISSQVFSTFISFFIHEHKLGTAAQSGQIITFFAIGGFLMGMFFGKIATTTKNLSLSIGFFLLGASFLMMAYAPNIILVYIASLITGFSFSIVMPSVFVGASKSVDQFSVPMALAVMTCAQNFSQFLSPYVITPIAKMMGGEINQSALILGAIIIIIMTIVALFWGIAKNKRVEVILNTAKF